MSLIQWFVNEQVEEENSTEELLLKYKRYQESLDNELQ